MSKSKPKPASKALPPVWMVVNGDSTYVCAFTTRYAAAEFVRWKPASFGWRIVKYAPVPPRSRKSKGGRRG